MKHLLASLSLTLLLPALVSAEDPEMKPIWPERAPGVSADQSLEDEVQQDERIGRRINRVTHPTIQIFEPEASLKNGTSVVICPGGGYNILAYDLEGVEVAKWLNSLGVTGIVLKYRVPRSKTEEKHIPPMQDAQRAVSFVRANAKKWGLNPERIGLMGFSAGGHLTAAAGTNFDKRAYEAVDDIDQVSCRPDFLMLIYPAYLLAKNDEVPLAPEIRVNEKTPPTLLIHTQDDGVTCISSLAFYLALTLNKVPGELHVYPVGGHGYGLRKSPNAVSTWTDRAEEWLRSRNLLEGN